MKRRAFIRAATLTAAAIAAPLARAAKPRVVIVGGGFGGSACALLLKHAEPSLDVTLVDPDARYVTCPLSNEVVVGARTIESLTLTRAGLARAGVRFVRARANALDAEARTIRLDDGTRLAYDRCVVAPGIRFLRGTPEGYDEAAAETMPHAWEGGAQTTRLAARLRALDNGGTFAISVPSGLMRCPPGPYERASLVAEYLARHKPRSKVLIFDANNRFPRQEIFTNAWAELYRGRIEWIPVTEGGAVERVDVRAGTLRTSSGAHRVALANVIPPQAPGQFALDAGL
ncbi:MAG TPA: FAD/NAD(P)-binding oxidoreductase, partial [Rhodanobacteraceae bacterium]